MACAICEVRKPRRFCPGVRGDICTICCGTEREVTVDCPLECPYLQEAHRHERIPQLDPGELPNKDIRVSDEFLRGNEELVVFLGQSVLRGAMNIPGVIDYDVREALDALIRTYRTLQSGVYYETRPGNPLADGIRGAVQEAVAEFRKIEQEQRGMTHTRDADVLGVLAFLERLERSHNNGRKRSRAFLNLLRASFGPAPDTGTPEAPSLIVP